MVQSGNKRKTLFVSFISSIFLSVFLFNPSINRIAEAAAGAITGTVYRDYNANGSQDTLEPGIQNIVVTAYGANNSIEAIATTDSSGNYSLSVGSGDYRVEFTPDSSQASWLQPGAQGDNGNTQVVFASEGDEDVNTSFNDPSQYCQSNPDVTTTCFIFGDHTDTVNTPDDAAVSIEYGTYGTDNVHNPEVLVSDAGSVYGLAYQRGTDSLFSSAFLKRHSDLGPNGPGAVYITNGGTTDLFVDLNNVSLPDGTPLSATTAGADPRTQALENSIPGDYEYTTFVENGQAITQTVSQYWFHDPEIFDKVGEWGIGDIDLSSDDEVLYIVNMKDRKLYAVDATTTPATTLIGNPVAIPDSCAVSADARPMAVKNYDGMVYVGVVCSAESTQSVADLKADVFAFDPATQSFNTTPELSVPLNYDRGCLWRDSLYDNVFSDPTACTDNNANWRPWENDWQVVFNSDNTSGGSHFFIEYPQPLLADIEFDNGSMILGFRDLVGDRVGYCAGTPDDTVGPTSACELDPADAGNTYGQGIFRGNALGDVLRACGDPTNGWELENTGWTFGGGADCSTTHPFAYTGFGRGPNGTSYYWNDNGPGGPGNQLDGGAQDWAATSGHDQTVIGGLAQLPGSEFLVTNQIDSSNVFNAGLVYFSNLDGSVFTGDEATGYEVRKDVLYSLSPDTFGKANGLGDIELFCDAAPTEVGNRVWNDVNANGIQDPGEAGISGVQLELTCGANSATTTTDANGNYLFSSATNATFMDAGEACTIQVISGAPSGSEITQGNMAVSDLHDNDADASGTINFVVGGAGENNTNLDVGYTTNNPVIPVTSEDGAIGNYVWLDENNDGVQDAGEPGIPNVTVMMTDSNGNSFQTVTDATGKYLFPDLPAGTYTVKVNPTNFGDGASLDGYTQTPTENGSADFGNKDDAAYVIVLGEGEEDLSADFGYNVNPNGDVDGNTGNAAVGDRVWIDLDGDGIQDPNEVGVEGVGVTLTDPGPDGLFGTGDDVTVATTTTDSNGNYLFDDVAPGAYEICVTGSSSAAQDVLDAGLYAPTGDPDHYGRAASSLGSDPAGLSGDNCTSRPVILAPGDVYLNVDFGYQPEPGTPVGSIGNTVWFDADADGNGPNDVNGESNGNGATDNNEEPIPGVSVALIKDSNGDGDWDAGEPIVATDVTDESGQYLFDGLALEQCNSGSGVDQNYLVWVNDTDSVLADKEATYDSDGDSGSATSAAGTLGLSAVTINCNNPDDTDQDFGYTADGQTSNRGLVGDTVWFDANNNGIQDADEAGIEGVELQLVNGSGTPIGDPVYTDENGNYAIGDLALNASYMVMVTDDNFASGGVLQGMDQTYDNDGSPTDGDKGTSTTLTSSASADLTLDFGYTGTSGKLGNLVWLDLNANGTYEPANGESTIGNVTVDLYRDLNCNGAVDSSDSLFSSATTAASIDATAYGSDGIYLFDSLPVVGNGSGSGACYVVDVTDENNELVGYWHSLGTSGTSNESQEDPYGGAGSLVLTAANSTNLTADFGYYVDPGCVGNRVWVDGNNDNVQGNVADTGLGGAVVTLEIDYPDGTTVSLSTVSDGNGFYEFCNLLLDEDYNDSSDNNEPNYTISVETPDGYTSVTPNQGGDDSLDGDNPNGVVANPIQGETDTDPQDPASDESPIASYDFGFEGTPPNPVDYGDAPDSYGTSGPDAAAHEISGPYLGSCVDGEGNGQPDAFAGTTTAGGDDNSSGVISPSGASCTDDEDGVTDTSASWSVGTNGGNAPIDASANGCLNAWVDFNRDGQFFGADEHVIVNELVTASTGAISFDVPAGGTDEPTFARYRLTARDAGLCTEVEPTGLVDSGEVEDYYLDFGIEADFGDLPAEYDGASHVDIDPALKLGNNVDGESEDQESAQADGDGSDDDGIIAAPEDWVDGSDPSNVLAVTVMGDGCLNGWIDWNSDGVFSGSSEHIIVNQLVSTGTTNVSFVIPDGGTAESPRFARYRLTPRDGNNGCSEAIGATGSVAGGEVEDYRYIVTDATAISLGSRDAANPANLLLVALLAMMGMLVAVVMSQRSQIRDLKPVEVKERS